MGDLPSEKSGVYFYLYPRNFLKGISMKCLSPFSHRNWGYYFLQILIVLVLSWGKLQAQHEEYVLKDVYKYFHNRFQYFHQLESPSPQDRESFTVFYYDTVDRWKTILATQKMGAAYNHPFLEKLNQSYLPQLDSLKKKWSFEPDHAVYQSVIDSLREQVQAEESMIKKDVLSLFERHPRLKEVLQYLALARSETITAGSIGDHDPASKFDIQSSAIAGVKRVIHLMNTIDWKAHPIDIGTLLEFHKHLLGKAAHVNSQPGKINDIHFKNEKGEPVHVYHFLKAWEQRVAGSTGAIDAMHRYSEFLHYHPLGDSNGRIAEVAKQLLLLRSDLPPLLTREKVSLENYFFQQKFGNTEYSLLLDAHDQLLETAAYLDHWRKVLEGHWRIFNIDLIGGNIAVQVASNQQTKLILANRGYLIKPKTELPPIKGSPVTVGFNHVDLKIKYSMNNWESQKDQAPDMVFVPHRIGRSKVGYYLYEASIPREYSSSQVSFAFHYKHPDSSKPEVWFKDGKWNYQGQIASWNQVQNHGCPQMNSNYQAH